MREQNFQHIRVMLQEQQQALQATRDTAATLA
jgi:hypothetical protein